MWYDVNKTLSYNALVNIVIGPRGTGKTYALKKKAIQNWVRKGKQFMYIRRYQSELDDVTITLFNDIIKQGDNEGMNIEFKNGEFMFNDETAGYAVSLTRAHYLKSASFPNVNLLIFDEFIVEQGRSSYLKNEVRVLLDLYETVARTREGVKLFLLANSLSFVNPYTVFWNIHKPSNKNVVRAADGLVLVELVEADEFKEFKRQTTFGKLIAGTDYEKYIIDNEFLLDSDTFIEKKSGICKYVFTFAYMGEMFGFWQNSAKGLYYVSEDVDPSCQFIYSVTLEDHRPNMMLLKASSRNIFKTLLEGYKNGIVRFENQKIKKMMENIFRMSLGG